jgi:hypothetical protein
MVSWDFIAQERSIALNAAHKKPILPYKKAYNTATSAQNFSTSPMPLVPIS